MKRQIALTLFAISSAVTFGAGRVQGYYIGTCQAQYAGTQANPCQMRLEVNRANAVILFGDVNCISPTNFIGVFYDYRTPVELRSSGWAAQPQGQTLTLNFDRAHHGRYYATGSGRGIKDGKWTYRCSFSQQ